MMADEGFTATALWGLLARRHGYGTWQEVAGDVDERFSEEDATRFRDEMGRAIEADERRGIAARGVNYLAQPALIAVPEALFLDAIEYGFEAHGGYGGGHPRTDEINQLFERRGIYFRFDRRGRAEWVGDPGVSAVVTQPALAALQDARLDGAAAEFQAARLHLRRGSNKDLEDAIDEAAKAVESSMKVLLDAKGVPRTGKETASPLFNLLRDNGIVEAEADNLVLGAARIRNQWGGHGAGSHPRSPPPALAELAVQGAAAAVIFLSARLP